MLVCLAPAVAAEIPLLENNSDPALRQALANLLQDYRQRLPQSRFISVNVLSKDAQGVPGFEVRDWSPRVAAFRTACKQSAACETMLRQQLDLLQRTFLVQWQALQAANFDDEARQRELAILASLLVNLPQDAVASGKTMALETGPFAELAVRLWRSLGNTALARWYADNQAQLQSLLGQKPAPQNLLHQAGNFELLYNDLADARTSWLLQALQALAEKNARVSTISLLHVARLDARLGNQQRAQQWLNNLDQLPGAGKPQGCDAQLLRARVAVQLQPQAFPEPGLLKAGCGIATLSIEHALARLRAGEQAQQVIMLALQQCKLTGRCYATQTKVLQDLAAIARRDATPMRKLAHIWQQNFLTAGPADPDEYELVWALADGLAALARTQIEAHALYAQLDDYIGNGMRSRAYSGTAGGQENIARFDALRRVRLLSEFRAGAKVDLAVLESLRGHRLLQKLQRARWAKEYAGVEDAAARQDLAQAQQQLQQLNTALQTLQQDATARLLLRDLQNMADDYAKFTQDQYYAALAGKRGGYRAGFGNAWTALTLQENLKQTFAQPLSADEVYLSWLKVPGGYLAVLRSGVALRKRFDAPDLVYFVATEQGLAQSVALYRELLLSGGATPSPTADGISLNDIPVWRLPNGQFVADFRTPAKAQRVRNIREISDALSQALLGPAMPQMPEAKRLIISPDGELALLPFETLTRQGKFLHAQMDVGYVQSLSIHAELKARLRKPSDATPPAVLTLADPAYAVAKAGDTARGSRFADWRQLEWPRLPGTRQESAAVAQLFPHSTRLLDQEASKARLLQLNQKGDLVQFRILHFATHGYFDDERSALVLASPDFTASLYLLDEEVAQLTLHSDLVLLSACSTGLGRNVTGEGVVGLPFALFMAGNANTLMTLWDVDDAGTAQFIPAYLRRIQSGEDMVQALNRTKQAFARGDFGAAYRDPRIWAPFVLYGVPGKVKNPGTTQP